ncbi:MAG: hypothetical protein KAW16_08285 [candidate division Zixibacteria bacterium]|nr:hypothetical protein [candidate division Zixibacteria bacterium]
MFNILKKGHLPLIIVTKHEAFIRLPSLLCTQGEIQALEAVICERFRQKKELQYISVDCTPLRIINKEGYTAFTRLFGTISKETKAEIELNGFPNVESLIILTWLVQHFQRSES